MNEKLPILKLGLPVVLLTLGRKMPPSATEHMLVAAHESKLVSNDQLNAISKMLRLGLRWNDE